MESKPKFLVYDRREIWVLFLLGLFVALFAFTLGLHFGRRLQSNSALSDGTKSEKSDNAPLQKEAEDKVATKDDFPIETPQGVKEMSNQVVDEATAEQVEVQDLKLKEPKSLELPEKTKSKNAGATTAPQAEVVQTTTPVKETPKSSEEVPSIGNHKVSYPKKIKQEEATTSKSSTAPHRIFVLQVGSFPDQNGAASKVAELKGTGLEAMIEEATVKDLGLRYRVLVGKFPSKKSAEIAGKTYQDKKLIEQYFVSVRSGHSEE